MTAFSSFICSLSIALIGVSTCFITFEAAAGDRLRFRSGEVDLMNLPAETAESTGLLRLPHFSIAQDEEQEPLSLGRPAWVGTKEKQPSKKADARKVHHFVVQMNDRLANEDFINFKSLKLQVLLYVPDDAVVVACTARKAQVLAKSSNRIRAITRYRPEWKLSPELGASSVFSGDPTITSVVSLFPDQDMTAVSSVLKNSKLKLKANFGHKLVLEAKRSTIQSLAKLDAVQWIEPAPGIELPIIEDDGLLTRVTNSIDSYFDVSPLDGDNSSSSAVTPVTSEEEVKAVREYLIDDRGMAAPSVGMVKAVIMHAAKDLFPNEVSRGSVDVAAAKSLAASLLVDERIGLGPSEVHLYPVTLAKRTELSATLSYTDAPSVAAAAGILVNDLDLAIIDSSGKRFELGDDASNFEHLAIQLPAGNYRIEVRGANVPMMKQPYALVVSAAL